VCCLVAAVQDPCSTAETDPPQPAPVLLVVVDEYRDVRVAARVLDPEEGPGALRLLVDSRVEGVAFESEHDRNEVWPAVRAHRRQAGDARPGHLRPEYARIVHLGAILPNYGEHASPDGILRTTELAEELGFDSVWATEHVIVGPEAAATYGRVYDPLVTLGWIAGKTSTIRLGTSIILVALHHPIELAKQVATLQLVSRRNLYLGVGMGWHEDEFRFMGVDFHTRGRRADEALQVMKALWRGESTYHGERWSFENATFAPLPELEPEIWVGGSSVRAIKRARTLGDVWHPSRGSDADHVRRVKERYPELRIVPRATPERVEGLLDAGADGVVVSFPNEASMRDIAGRYR
jgi:probable F420-dependent oxidoreductase